MRRRYGAGLLAALALLPVSPAPMAQGRGDLQERIEVLGEPWRVGDRKSYSFVHQELPIARLEITAVGRTREGDRTILEFLHKFWIASEGLGQKGKRRTRAHVVYAGRKALHYEVAEQVTVWERYKGDRPAGVRDDQETHRSEPEAILVDIEMVGHLERLVLDDTLRVGDRRSYQVRILPRRYDYRADSLGFLPEEETIDIQLRVVAREPILLFGTLEIDAFRCEIPELGYTLWLSEGGALLRFDNGNHLVATLEE